jgi:phage terminase large subunit
MPEITIPKGAVNACYLPYLQNEKRVQIYFGGAASGKSVFLATRVALDTLTGRNTLVVRFVARTLRGSCWNEILKAISRMGLAALFTVSKAEYAITSRFNGAQILFAGLDDVEKIKSITPSKGALTDIWVEEATEAGYEDIKQLEKRLRGPSPHPKRLTLSFNPVHKAHWIYKTYFGLWDEGKTYAETAGMSILKTTYRDNRFLTQDDRLALENEKDPYFRAVYTLGNWGVPGGAIFTAWRGETLGRELYDGGKFLYGLDFGFAGDPCAAVKVCCDRARRRVVVLDELYARGMTNARLAEALKAFAGGGVVTCDSAEPKSIREMQSLGIRAVPARKGPDSVLHGIQWLQGHEIIADTRCVHLKEELAAYRWRRDREGNSLPEPEGRNDHLLDALRYALETESQDCAAYAVRRPNIGEWLNIV